MQETSLNTNGNHKEHKLVTDDHRWCLKHRTKSNQHRTAVTSCRMKYDGKSRSVNVWICGQD